MSCFKEDLTAGSLNGKRGGVEDVAPRGRHRRLGNGGWKSLSISEKMHGETWRLTSDTERSGVFPPYPFPAR